MLQPRNITRKKLARFLEQIVFTDECWIWTGSVDNKGYGRFRDGKNKILTAHRAAYFYEHGVLPEKPFELDHLCRNTVCVNPAHLEAVTHRENMIRGVRANSCKTHCPAGHEYAGDNLYTYKEENQRFCRTCRNDKARAAYIPTGYPVGRRRPLN